MIGPKQTVTSNAANGIFDTFDQFRNSSTWPLAILPPTYVSLSTNSGTVLENSSTTLQLTTTNITVNTTLYWTILHGNSTSADFGGSTVSGQFTQFASSQLGSFTYTTNFTGNTSKTAKTYQIQIRTNSTAGTVVYTSGTFTIPTLTVSSIGWSPASSNEGTSNTYLSFMLGNCGTWSTWTFNISYSGTAVAADTAGLFFSTIRNPGVSSIGSAYTIVNDSTTEGSETLIAQLSYNGFIIGAPQTLTINDTSQTPTGTITPSNVNVTEGSGGVGGGGSNGNVIFSVTVSGSFTGTAYYTVNNVTGTMSTADFTDSLLSGSFSVTSGTGSFTKTLVPDGVVEGEAFSVSLRSGSTIGPILATTSTITVTDAAAPAVTWSNTPSTFTNFGATTAAGIVNNYYRRYFLSFAYTQAEMQSVLGTSNVTLYGIRFYVNSQPTNQPYPSYAVGMKNGTFTSTSNPGGGGYTIVSDPQSQSFTGGAYKEILFPTPFVWLATGGLSVAIAWGQCPTNYSSTGTTRVSAGNIYFERTDGAGAYTVNGITGNQVGAGLRPVVEFKLTA